MKKWTALLLALVMCLLLCACGHTHEWVDATFSEPKTCKVCGEKEGNKKPTFFEENNVEIADKLNGFDLQAVFVDRETDPTVTAFQNCKVTVKSNTSAPSETREGYTTYKLVYTIRCVAVQNTNFLGVDMGTICDEYTGYVFEDRTTEDTDTSELYDSVTIDGEAYTLYYTKQVEWGEWEWSDADNAPVSNVDVTYVIEAPSDYHGLLIFFEDQSEWVPYEENDELRSFQLDSADLGGKHFFHVA